jgi:hypothetical protein
MSSNDLKLAKIAELQTQIELLEKQLNREYIFSVKNTTLNPINFNGKLIKHNETIVETALFNDDKSEKVTAVEYREQKSIVNYKIIHQYKTKVASTILTIVEDMFEKDDNILHIQEDCVLFNTTILGCYNNYSSSSVIKFSPNKMQKYFNIYSHILFLQGGLKKSIIKPMGFSITCNFDCKILYGNDDTIERYLTRNIPKICYWSNIYLVTLNFTLEIELNEDICVSYCDNDIYINDDSIFSDSSMYYRITSCNTKYFTFNLE